MISFIPLFQYLEKNNIKTKDLYPLCGKDTSYFLRLEKGLTGMSVSSLDKICSALNIAIHEAVCYIPSDTEIVNYKMEFQVAESIDFSPMFEIMKRKGATTYTVSKGLGLSSGIFARFRRGQSCTVRTLFKIASFLNVAPNSLYKIKAWRDYSPLFDILAKKNMKTSELEYRCRINTNTLNRLKRGFGIRDSTIKKIADYLNVPQSELYTLVETPPSYLRYYGREDDSSAQALQS